MNIAKIRKDFPILEQRIGSYPLIYLDNAATTQVPEAVMQAMWQHYTCSHANVHRGSHTLSSRSTDELERAREKTAAFLNAKKPAEIVFTQGATAALNMIALGLEHDIRPGDEIIVTDLEHHSNYLPWQQLCKRTGAVFKQVPMTNGYIEPDTFRNMLSEKTKIAAFTHVSNLTGAVHKINSLTAAAKKYGALTVIDGAQAVRHEIIDVQKTNCDFYCFSGHKMLAGTGIGVLYGKTDALERLRPMWFGGGMVNELFAENVEFAGLPYRLEAGTGSFAQAVALGAAIDYILSIGREEISAREKKLTALAEEELRGLNRVKVIGEPEERAGCLSITVENIHTYDLSSVLNQFGVAVRSGTHCAQPALKCLKLPGTVRISTAFYNTEEEIELFIRYLKQSIDILDRWNR